MIPLLIAMGVSYFFGMLIGVVLTASWYNMKRDR